ncbi:SDR family oxidoreductase [Streptomyces chartreusis]|uniref:SDR family oxidoreductase n=1 Tax=Streptomyces chartreusis TaxID=1969 RepID=UPI003638AB47
MKVVVAGATGRIGSRSVTRLRDHGAQVVPLSRALGVNVGDAHALRRALRGAQILVEHYVALSAVGADRVASGYLRSKAVQEDLVRRSALPYSLVRATPFSTSVESAVCAGVHADGVHVAPLPLRPVAADGVAAPSPTSPSRCRCSASWRPPDPRSDRSRTSPPMCSPPRTARLP